MGDILILIVRRLRAPLITLICVYAISVFGLAMIPGRDADGRAVEMSYFHALYVMSYTATTIGFGEIPHSFTDAQRLWVIVCIYLSVIGWTYALGSLFAIAGDASFRGLVQRARFRWRVAGIGEPYTIVCGYGQSGSAIARALDRAGTPTVVIEIRAERAAMVAVDVYERPPIVIAADARIAAVLEDAGIRRPECRALLALAGDDATNQAIAIGARTLQPELTTLARVKSPLAQANLEAFGGIAVVNPYETFATNLALDLAAPDVLRLEEFLTAAAGTPCPERFDLPRGAWVLVGYGRFGRCIARALDGAGVAWHAVEPQLDYDDAGRHAPGEGMEAALKEAGVAGAEVLVAGTAVDAVNLGVITLARRMNPELFVVIRQNHVNDRVLVQAANAEVEFVQSSLMVHECLQRLQAPVLARVIERLRGGDAAAATRVLETVLTRLGPLSPRHWVFDCDILRAGVFSACFQCEGQPLTLAALTLDPDRDGERLAALPLALERGERLWVLPEETQELKPGDRVLFLGELVARRAQQRYADEPGFLNAIRTGSEPARGWFFRSFFRWWARRRARRLVIGEDTGSGSPK